MVITRVGGNKAANGFRKIIMWSRIPQLHFLVAQCVGDSWQYNWRQLIRHINNLDPPVTMLSYKYNTKFDYGGGFDGSRNE